MLAASLAGAAVTENVISQAELHASNPKAKALNVTLPCLELENGELLFTSIAIAKYLASLSADQKLLGSNSWEEAQVDQWLLVLRNEVQPLVRVINYQVFGHLETDQGEHTYLYN